MTDIRELHEKWMRDPDYRREYEALEGERFQTVLGIGGGACSENDLPNGHVDHPAVDRDSDQQSRSG